MGRSKIYGDSFKKLLFSNKGIRAVCYDGYEVFISIDMLSKMIHHTWFDVDEEDSNDAIYFTFDQSATR